VLKIRPEQFDTLVGAFHDAFRRRLEAQLRTHWPAEASVLGDEGVRARVALAESRSAQYGITADADVACFLNLLMALGPDFDVDPRYPWAEALLGEPAMAAARKVQRMCELALDELRAEQAG
jgi:hypothetical protein